MKTQTVKFIKYHISFAHDEGETVDLPEAEAKRAIDAGLAVAVNKAEKATADSNAEKAVVEFVTDKAANAAAEARSEAHDTEADAVVASVGTQGTTVVLPVATEADGTRVLAKPADNDLNQTSAPGEKVVDDKKKK